MNEQMNTTNDDDIELIKEPLLINNEVTNLELSNENEIIIKDKFMVILHAYKFSPRKYSYIVNILTTFPDPKYRKKTVFVLQNDENDSFWVINFFQKHGK